VAGSGGRAAAASIIDNATGDTLQAVVTKARGMPAQRATEVVTLTHLQFTRMK
jgi:hypothetical protein